MSLPDSPQERDVNPQYRDRMVRLEKWRALGVDPYGQRTDGVMAIRGAQGLHQGVEVTPHEGGAMAKVAGRIVLLRDIGKLIFITIRDWTGTIQIGLAKQHFVAPVAGAPADGTAAAGAGVWAQAKLLELGDIAWFEGKVGHTKTEEVTIWASGFGLLTKALLPPPDKFHGLSDTETRYRQRYVDLSANAESLDVFLFRSQMIESIREFLKGRRFVEVETPMMQSLAGGAAARPFVTHHNALDIDLYLRVSPELYLKRLMVGGMERVYEINRNFRNEGIDTTHNPEFTMMEVYQAYSDLAGMMELTESLFVRLAGERLKAIGKDATEGKLHLPFGDRVLDFSPPFERISYGALFKAHVGVEMMDEAAVARVAGERGVDVNGKEHDVVVGELFERYAEPTLVGHDRPVFVYDYPAALCPLTRRKPGDPRIAERFELYVAGMELANAYTELNDPVVQEETFSRQLAGQKAEDSMAKVDDDFVNALRYGMPPAGGLGIGIDRLAMVMTNRQSIRDVVLFPLLKPTASVLEMDEARVEADVAAAEQAKAEAIKRDKIPVFFAHDKDGNLRIVDL